MVCGDGRNNINVWLTGRQLQVELRENRCIGVKELPRCRGAGDEVQVPRCQGAPITNGA